MESFFVKRREKSTLRHEVDHLCDTFEVLSTWEDMSLRETEQIFGRMHLVLRATPQNKYLFPALAMFLVVMRIKQPETYLAYIASTGDLNPAREYLHSLASEEDRANSFNAALIEGLLIAAKHPHLNENDQILKEYIDRVTNSEASDQEIQYSRTVVHTAMNPSDNRNAQVDLDSLFSRVEMFAKYDFSDTNNEVLDH